MKYISTIDEGLSLLKNNEKYNFNCLVCGKLNTRIYHKYRTLFLTCKGECTGIYKGQKVKYTEETLEVKDQATLDNLQKQYKEIQKVSFNCISCNKPMTVQLRVADCLLCDTCKLRRNNLEKYGVTNAGWTPEAIQKRKQTCLEKYNTEYAMQSKEVQGRSRQAVIDKYGVDCVFKLDYIKERSKKTKFEKYGDENYTNIPKMQETMKERYGGTATLNSKELLEKVKQTMNNKYGPGRKAIVEKIKQTKLERYNNENYNNNPKAKETCIQKYGVDSFSKTPEFREKSSKLWVLYLKENKDQIQEKIQQTCFQKYGTKSFVQSEQAKYSRYHRYELPGDTCLHFDSSWELAAYIFAKDHNIPIEREPISFSYEYNKKEHIYFPDFKFGEILIEIKGDQFFKEDGTMQNPYDHSMDSLYEAKHQCALQNNVQFWTSKEMQPILEYVNTTYGFDFLDSFKVITD